MKHWKKAKYNEIHEHMICRQYPSDHLELIITYKCEDYLIAKYRNDTTGSGLLFKSKRFGTPFNELYIETNEQRYEQLKLL